MPQHKTEHRNIKIAGQLLQPMNLLPGRYDPPGMNFPEREPPCQEKCGTTKRIRWLIFLSRRWGTFTYKEVNPKKAI